MALLSYFNPLNLERDNNGDLGILRHTTFGTSFYPLGSELDALLNDDNCFSSFSCQIDIGSCTFSKEFKKSGEVTKGYWYASKKIKGKLKRVYYGAKPLTLESLHATLDKFNIAPAPKPIELAGHGKHANHIQPSLVEIVNDPLNIAIAKSNRLERENKDLNKSLIDALDKIKKLETSLKASEYRRQDLSQDCEDIKCQLTAQSDKYRNYGLAVAITNERNQELEKRVKELGYLVNSTQKVLNVRDKELATCQKALLSRIDSNQELEKNIFKLEQDYKTGEQEAFDNLDRFCSIVSIIDKYRALADGKTRQAHPRFNKLLDFIADIDKLC